MWRRSLLAQQQRRLFHQSQTCRQHPSKNVIEIKNATFYRRYPADQNIEGFNPAFFPGLTFNLPASQHGNEIPQFWAVLSSSSLARTAFLQVLAAQHICIPPNARKYPYISDLSLSPQNAVKYVGFDAERGGGVGGSNVRGAYLSARYESRREETDFSLHDYLTGRTQLNALEPNQSDIDTQVLEEVIRQLNLRPLLEMPVTNLSNGQTRRARIAKALMARPEVLLLDGPFMGLDPNTITITASVLQRLAASQKPRVIMSLRPEDGVPGWINHLVIADEKLGVLAQGLKEELFSDSHDHSPNAPLGGIIRAAKLGHYAVNKLKLSKDGFTRQSPALTPGGALVEMRGVKVSYGDKTVLGDWDQVVKGENLPGLWWSLHMGQRCGIFGANGSGKTTMLSLITSDHPQTYSLPIKLFGRSRLPGPGEAGISLFDIQRRMGHSSPEVHAFFPKQLTVRRAIQSAWADAPLSRPKLTNEAARKVDACLQWFATELNPGPNQPNSLEMVSDAYNARPDVSEEEKLLAARKAHDEVSSGTALGWADELRFRELSFSNQRLVLFLRAVVAHPDLVILDEALSGIDEHVRDKALLFLSHGEKISEVKGSTAEPSILAKLDRVEFAGLTAEQALLVISHAKEDVPGCVREWICLPEPGEGAKPRTGTLEGPLELNPRGWDQIWGNVG